MNNDLISIIIPTFNRADFIIQTLESIQNQSYKNFECLTIDDGSTDNTEMIVQKKFNYDKRFQFLKRPLNTKKGPNACRNYGFQNAKGDFIYFFDSDDFLKPHALETYIKGFQGDADGVLAQVERVNHETGILQDINTIESNNLIEDYFTYKICYFVCGILWRKSFLDRQNELFDESIGNHDEWDFNLRMIYAQPKIIKIQQPLAIYYQHHHSFKNEVRKGNDLEIHSAFAARYKHLDLLVKLHPKNKIKYTNHIAYFYTKTVRNKLLLKQSNWFQYYKSAVYLRLKTRSFRSILHLSIGIFFLKFFRKGYSFFK